MILYNLSKMTKRNFHLLLLSISFLFFSSGHPLFAQNNSQKIIINQDSSAQIQAGPKVTARVGGYLYNIEGLTSPQAKVDLKSTQGNLYLTTYANQEGKFHFQNVLVGPQPGQFCFFATDIDQNPSPPLCIDPPAPAPVNFLTGIILPPSLTIDKGIFRQGDRVNAYGLGLPNAKLEVFLFEKTRPPIFDLLDLVKPSFVTLKNNLLQPAWAKNIAEEGKTSSSQDSPVPKIAIHTDEKGRFSLNLPSAQSGRWRIFAGAFWQKHPVSPSHTLEFSSLPWWQWMILRFWLAIKAGFKASLVFLLSWPVLIFMQILLIGVIGLKIKKKERS